MIIHPLKRRSNRRGTSMVEAAIVIVVFLMLILGIVDLGVLVMRHQMVAQTARQAARLAIIHGKFCPAGWQGGTWGPTTIDVQANATGVPIVDALTSLGAFAGMNPANTTLRVEWLDSSVDPEVPNNRVRATVSTNFTPMVTFVFGSPTWTVRGSSTMNMAH